MDSVLTYRPYWQALGWLLVVAVAYLSLTPAPPQTDLSQGDKLGHLAAYAGLMAWWHPMGRNGYRLALLFVLMGLALEILQSFTGYRQGDIFDMAANTAGVGLGWLWSARLAPGWLVWCDRKLST